MIKFMSCWGKRVVDECNYYGIEQLNNDINIARRCLNDIEKLQLDLEGCIKENSIKKVIFYHVCFISDNFFDEVRQKSLDSYLYLDKHNKCIHNPDSCKIINNDLNLELVRTLKLLNRKLNKYNSDLAVIKQVQNYYKDIGTTRLDEKDIYLRFSRDKYNALIVLFFDFNKFFNSKRVNPYGTIYVFSGNSTFPFRNHTMLHFEYCSWFTPLFDGTSVYEDMDIMEAKGSGAYICDFVSNNRRRGHGSFLLSQFEKILTEINMKIINENYRRYGLQTIEFINGEVCPGDIPYISLVDFYNKNGLKTIDKIYPNGDKAKDRVIFKRLNGNCCS